MRLILPVITALLCLCSCRSVRYVEAPSVYCVRDTVRQTSLQTDSVLIRDSVYVEGERVYRERILWRTRTVTDTVYISRVDTARISVPCPAEREAQKSPPWYDTASLWLGRAALIMIFVWFIIWYVRRKHFSWYN